MHKWTVEEKINHYVIIDKEQPHASPVAIGMTKETANLIVQTHNSFDGLLEACKLAKEYIFKGGNSRILGEKLNEAIAQAEE